MFFIWSSLNHTQIKYKFMIKNSNLQHPHTLVIRDANPNSKYKVIFSCLLYCILI